MVEKLISLWFDQTWCSDERYSLCWNGWPWSYLVLSLNCCFFSFNFVRVVYIDKVYTHFWLTDSLGRIVRHIYICLSSILTLQCFCPSHSKSSQWLSCKVLRDDLSPPHLSDLVHLDSPSVCSSHSGLLAICWAHQVRGPLKVCLFCLECSF